jgi:opacity protein-like surface antigen
MFTAAAIAALLTSTAADAQGWYASILGGATLDTPRIEIGSGSALRNDGFNAGGRLGYSLDRTMPWSGFALEADIFYNQSHFDGTTDARLSSLSEMGNLIYHVNTGWPVGFYGGAGAGAVRTALEANGGDSSSTVFGWQAIGGVDFAFAPGNKFFAEYRYQNAHNANLFVQGVGIESVSNTSNNVSVGVKFDL